MKARVAAVIALGTSLSLLLVYLLSGGGAEIFAAKFNLVTYMPNSAGITTASPVRINGIEAGRVTKVQVSPSMEKQRAVRVDMQLQKRFMKAIPRDSQAFVRADNLVGDTFVLIKEGKSPAGVSEGDELRFEELNLAIDNADLMRTLERNLNAADAILISLASKDSKFGNLLLTEDYYNTLLSRVVEFNKGLHIILTPQSNIGKAFYTLEAYRNMLQPLQQFDAQLAAIQRGEGQGGKLFASDEQYTSMVQALRNLRASLADANAGKGALGAALKTDDDYKRVRQLLRSTDAMLTSLNAGEGQFGQLLANPQLYESLNGSLRSLELLLQDVHSNPKKYLRVKIF